MDAGNLSSGVSGEIIEITRSEKDSLSKTKVAAAERLAWAKTYATKNVTQGPWVVMAAVKEHFGVGIGFYAAREMLEAMHPGKSRRALQEMWIAARDARKAAEASKDREARKKAAKKKASNKAKAEEPAPPNDAYSAYRALEHKLDAVVPWLDKARVETITGTRKVRSDGTVHYSWSLNRVVTQQFY